MRRLLLTLLPAAALTSAAAASPAAAQTLADYDYENLTFRGVGVDVGYLWPSKVDDTESFGIRLDLGYLGPGIRIIPSLSYWASDFTDDELDDLAEGLGLEPDAVGSLRWSDINISLDGQFVWNTPIQLLTFVGAGVGLHALNGQGEAFDDTFVEDLMDSITAGVNAMAGAEFEVSPRFRVYGEGRYTALNSIQYITVKAGAQLMFNVGEGVVGSVAPVPVLEGLAP